MARYQLLCLIFVATMDIRTCYGETSATLKEQESTLPELAKEVEDNSRYKTLEANATVLKLLVDDKNGVSRSEVFDMLHSRDDNDKHVDLPTFPEDTEDARAEVPSVPDAQAEFLQVPGEEVRKDSQKIRYSAVRGEPIGAAAGIMVVVTCSIVCLAYTALIVWRRIYLKRNGLKHELLRNEENIAETRIEVARKVHDDSPGVRVFGSYTEPKTRLCENDEWKSLLDALLDFSRLSSFGGTI